jgi:hypothetical protein
VTRTILGELHGIRTASFGVLASPPSPISVGQVVGHCSFYSKTPSGSGAHVEAFIDSSSTTAMLA